jgi:hypothetical protein
MNFVVQIDKKLNHFKAIIFNIFLTLGTEKIYEICLLINFRNCIIVEIKILFRKSNCDVYYFEKPTFS